jgi:Spy/CpxP family protein refolding chaperone
MKALGLITISLCCIAAPLAAQDTTHARRPGQRPHAGTGQRGEHGGMDDMMPMMREMMAPLMRVMAYTPGHLLSRKDSLKLTPDQISKLTAIQTSAKSAHDAAAADMKTHMGALAQAFQSASPDTNAIRTHFEAVHSAMGKAHWAMLSAAAQARAALTDAQRQKVDAWLNAMEQREGHEHSM